MPTPAGILTDLARLLLLARDQHDRLEEQTQAAQRIASGLAPGGHLLRVTPAGFGWDRVELPLDRGELTVLHTQMLAHALAEVRLPDGVRPLALLALCTLLGQPRGSHASFEEFAARLAAADGGAITLLPLPAGTAPPPPAELPAADPVNQIDREGQLTAVGHGAATEAVVGVMHFLNQPTEASGPVDELLARLPEPMSADQGFDLLNDIVLAGEAEARAGRWARVLDITSELVRLESTGLQAGGPRGIAIALRRLLPRPFLAPLVPFTARGGRRAEAIAVLRRMGVDGTEVLVSALTEAEDLEVRRAYFNALKEVAEGNNLLVNMLTHDQWFVVRNVALLCGELRMEAAVPALARLISHEDDRVRRAAAGALARIGGTGTADPLRRALRDPSTAVRHDLAKELDGQRNRNLGMSLATAAEEEADLEVRQQMYLALGRIGSREAVQALRQAAEPGGKLIGRKPVAIRLAAVAGLHAAGPSGAQALKELSEDGDREVREAALAALQTLWS